MTPSPEAVAVKSSSFTVGIPLILSLVWLLSISGGINCQASPTSSSLSAGPSSPQSDATSPPSSSSSSSSSFVLADPNIGAPQSAFSAPGEPSPILPAQSTSSQSDAPVDGQQQQSAPASDPQSNGGGATGGYGSLMATPPAGSIAIDLLGSPQNDDQQSQQQQQEQQQPSQQGGRMSDPGKRHQFSQYPEAGLVPGVGLAPAGPVPAAGTCPGGASLPIECDPKRPWPQCPPQSYCYATNTVDIGPYFCCPIWSTYGAAWRPATPFYSYAPPPPPNWPEPMRMAAAPAYGGPMAPIRKGRKEQRFDDDGHALMTEEEQRKILQVMNDWVERQKAVVDNEEAAAKPPSARDAEEAAPAPTTAAVAEDGGVAAKTAEGGGAD